MKAEFKKIYDAHVQFELEQFNKKHLKANIKEDVHAVFTWFETVKLSDISSDDKVKKFLERNVKIYELSDEQRDYAKDLAKHVHDHAKKSKHKISDYITEERYFELAEKLIGQKEWREELIEKIASNPVYGEIIADTLYDGIKQFMQQSGPSNESVGGSLFNIGKGLLGAALSGVQDNIDATVKKFIAQNLSKTLQKSEQQLKDRFSEPKLRLMSKSIWNKIHDIKISDYAKKIKTKDINDGLEIAEQIAGDTLRNSTTEEIAHFVVDHFFEYVEDKTIAQLLEEIGITAAMAIKEAEEFAIPILEKAAKDGFLQARIEARLSKFYKTL